MITPPSLAKAGINFASAYICKNNAREVFNIGVEDKDSNIFIADVLTSPRHVDEMMSCLKEELLPNATRDDYLKLAYSHCLP